MNLFDISNNLTQSHEYIWSDELEKDYLPFLINRSISQHLDTLMHTNEMNIRQELTKKQQYDYYHFAIQPKRKRFAKWGKPEKDETIQIVSDFYKCSKLIAEQYASFLKPEDISHMKEKMSKGGRA